MSHEAQRPGATQPKPSLLARLGNHIATKRNFVRASVFGFGVPFGVAEAFLVAPYGPWVVIFAALLGPVAGYVWGLCMWHLMFKGIYARRAERERTQQ